jgi:alpha-tubulin suppressor-like RCC1 family protein
LLVFGQGEDGQLGLGDSDERHLPAPIRLPDASLIKSISCGAEHTVVVLDESKTVFSWGE